MTMHKKENVCRLGFMFPFIISFETYFPTFLLFVWTGEMSNISSPSHKKDVYLLS